MYLHHSSGVGPAVGARVGGGVGAGDGAGVGAVSDAGVVCEVKGSNGMRKGYLPSLRT